MSSMKLRIVLLVGVVGSGVGCGGGSDVDAGTDGCTTGICLGEAGMDAGGDSGRMDMGTPVDSGVDTGVNLMTCDATLTTDTCGAGMHCAVTLHFSTVDGGMTTVGYGECVPQPATHLVLGSTCGGFQPVGTIPNVSADPCGDGLFCWNNPDSTIRRCQQICDPTHACGTGQFCIELNGAGPPAFGACAMATNCDPLAQDCLHGQGCYVVPDDTGALYTSCFPVEARASMLPDGGSGDGGIALPGDTCTYLGNCLPGDQCVISMLADGGTQGVCRTLCDTTLTGGTDAGPLDAGTVDLGDVDLGDVDLGDVDAGDVDAATPTDAGPADAGPAPRICTGSGTTCMGFASMPDASVVFTQPLGYCL